MLDSVVPIPTRENGTSSRDTQLPTFTESLTLTQRYPCMVVVGGLALTIVAGVAGLMLALGGGQ